MSYFEKIVLVLVVHRDYILQGHLAKFILISMFEFVQCNVVIFNVKIIMLAMITKYNYYDYWYCSNFYCFQNYCHFSFALTCSISAFYCHN